MDDSEAMAWIDTRARTMPSKPSREFMLLCYLIGASGRKSSEDLRRINIDWMAIASLAERHRVRPQLLYSLGRTGRLYRTSETAKALGDFELFHRVQCLYFGKKLLSIANSFDNKGVRFATFKGLVLALSLYQDMARREYNDIDLIIHEFDLQAAETCLGSCGYHPREPDPFYRKAFLAYHNQYIFEADEVMIDLHWDFAPKGVPFPLQAGEIWGNLELVSIAAREFQTLGSHDLAVYLAGHGTKEGWRSLKWVCDYADFIGSYPEMDWVALWRRAAHRHCGQPILLGCTLASRLLDAPVNEELLARADRDLAVRTAANEAIARLAAPCSPTWPEAPEDFLGNLALCETWSQKAAVLWGLASTRTTGDYEAMPLPPFLWRTYYLTRPFRLGMRLLANARTRS